MAEYLKHGKETGTGTDAGVQARVSDMLADIAARGEAAVRDFSRSLDHHDPPSFRIDDAAVSAAIDGVDEIYALGGVQAMGAMAYGALDSLAPVDMIVGAGNAFVAEAKRQLFGRVGIDLLAGPTEVLVIADDTADAHTVAVDLLAQAEHGPTSPAVLITTSRVLAVQVMDAIPAILDSWPTGDVAGQAWRDLGVVALVESAAEAVELADAYASEHLQLQVSDARWYEEALRNYGTIFSGEETTVAFGDKATGTNHTLPTNGAARYTGGLWVGSYIKVCTFQRLSPQASVRVGRHTSAISTAERMFGHAASADLRVEKYQADSPDSVAVRN